MEMTIQVFIGQNLVVVKINGIKIFSQFVDNDLACFTDLIVVDNNQCDIDAIIGKNRSRH